METTAGNLIDIEPGATVYGSDGEKLGAIMEIGPDYIVVEKGLFFPTDYFVPNGAIASVEPDRITLTLTRDEALEQGWDKDPTEHADVPQYEANTVRPVMPGDGPGSDSERQPVTGFAARTVGSDETGGAPAGLASELGTVPPAADFATLGVAPVDVNSAYMEGDVGWSGEAGQETPREATDGPDPRRPPRDDGHRGPSGGRDTFLRRDEAVNEPGRPTLPRAPGRQPLDR
jgi:hypothetical protein